MTTSAHGVVVHGQGRRGRPVSSGMAERDLQAAIINLARVRGWMAYHTHDSRHSEAGFPDLTLVHLATGRLLFLELKSDRGRTTAEQELWLSALRLGGHAARVIRPSDWLDGTVDGLLGGAR